MKKLFFTLFLTQTIITLFSQNTWEYFRRDNDLHELISMMIELDDGNFLSVGSKLIGNNSENENKNYGCIRKHSKLDGSVVKEADYKVDSLATHLGHIFYDKTNETFTITGEAHKYFDNKKRGYFIVTHWDSELNLISDTIIRLQPYNENNELQFFSGINAENGDYILLGNYFEFPKYPWQNNKLLFARISREGNIELSNWFREPGGGNHCSIIELNGIKKYILPGWTTYYFDENFNKIDSIITENSIDRLLRYNSTAVKFPDNKYLCSVRFNSNTWKGIGLFNTDMNILKSFNVSKSDSPHDNPFANKSFDFIDTSAIFVGTQLYDSGYFTIAKVNSDLKPYWIKYFSEKDSIAHAVSGVKATVDGGFIVYGFRGKKVDFSYLPYEFGSWALKLDANGNTVSTQEPGHDTWEITVFPNPSSGDFRIEIAGDADENMLLLYDLEGKEVKRYQNLTVGTNTFQFDGIHEGVYIWKLLNKGKEIGEGKWVKTGL